MANCPLQCQWMNGITINYEEKAQLNKCDLSAHPKTGYGGESGSWRSEVTSLNVVLNVTRSARYEGERLCKIWCINVAILNVAVVNACDDEWRHKLCHDWLTDIIPNLTQPSKVIEANTGNLANVSLHAWTSRCLTERQDLVQHQ